jgi:hypothetical protein
MAYLTKNDKLYNSWRKMHIRCYSVDYHSYHRYGGRGIKVCPEWQEYAGFKADMESSWFVEATLDRINSDGDYTRANCRWQTKSENRKPFKYDILEIRRLYNEGMNQYEIAKLLGTYQPHISRLLRRTRSG